VAAFNDPQAPALVPARQDWNPQALDALFGIVQDAAADPKARRKAALRIAEFLLPKSGKKAKAVADDYGFTINPKLASEYRNIQLEVRSLAKQPTRKLPAVGLRILKLRARSDAVLRRLPASDGNLYPHESKSRPTSAHAADDQLIDAGDEPPISTT
jgi:hypothetical protein